MSDRPCPYRKVHEYDAEGLCLHCFAKAPPPPPVEPPVLEGLDSAFAVSPATQSVYTNVNGWWSSSYGATLPSPLTQQQIDDFVKQLAKDKGQP